jgi:hypothetical protein
MSHAIIGNKELWVAKKYNKMTRRNKTKYRYGYL